MAKVWLPPIETCCDECKTIAVHVYKNSTLHFQTSCPVHGQKYVPSPFARSVQIEYKVIISEELSPGAKKKYKEIQNVPGQMDLIEEENEP